MAIKGRLKAGRRTRIGRNRAHASGKALDHLQRQRHAGLVDWESKAAVTLQRIANVFQPGRQPMNFVPTSLKNRVKRWWTGEESWRAANRAELLSEKLLAHFRSGQLRLLPFLDPLTAETQAMRDAYREMLREPSVKAPLLDKLFSVASLDLQAIPADPENPRDRMIADYCRDLVLKSRGGLRAVAEAILLPALLEGFSLCERKPVLAERGKWKGKYLLEELRSVDSKLYRLKVDEFNKVVAIESTVTREEWNPAEFVFFRHLAVFSSIGMSDLRAAFRAFWVKHAAWQLRAIGLERFTLPIMIGKYPAGGDQAALELALKQVRSMGYITAPNDAVIEALNIANRGEADFKSAIADLNEEMYTAIAGAFLQSLTGGQNVQRGSSDVHRSTSELRVWHLAACLEDVLSDQLFKFFVDLNFAGVEDYPRAKLGGVNDADLEASLRIDEGLLRAGVPLSKKDLLDKYKRQGPVDAADAVAPPQPAAAVGAGYAGFSEGGPAGGADDSLPFNAEAFAECTCWRWNKQAPTDAEIGEADAQLSGQPWFIRHNGTEWVAEPRSRWAEFAGEDTPAKFSEGNSDARIGAMLDAKLGAFAERIADALTESLLAARAAAPNVPREVFLPEPPKPRERRATIAHADGGESVITITEE